MRTGQDLYRLIGQRLRTRRRLLDLTQSQVGRACGVTFQQVQKYEAGGHAMSVSRLLQLAEALDAPITYFIDPDADEAAPPAAEGANRRKCTRAAP